MLSRLRVKPLHSIKLRLALLSGSMFALGILLTYALLDFSLTRALRDRVDQYLLTEFREFRAIYEAGGLPALQQEIVQEQDASAPGEFFACVLDEKGASVAASDLSAWDPVVYSPPIRQRVLQNAPVIDTVHVPREDIRIRRVYGLFNPQVAVVMGCPLTENAVLIAALRARVGWVLGAMLVFSVLAAWLIAQRAMKGVEAVTETAIRIAGGDLNRRVAAKGYGMEIDLLAQAFNQMLDRVAALMNEIKEITDNIAHELRSPIARIRGSAEVTLLSNAPLGRYQEMTADIIEDCDSLLALANAMLDISEIEAGVAELERQPVDVAQMARDACDLFQPAAEDRGVTIRVLAGESAVVPGDNRKLHQALANLLDNAVKYTPRGGAVTVSVEQTGDTVVISVADTGLGIAADDLPRIFDRFYRGDQSRAKPGNGLGLNLVRAVVKAHHGRIDVASRPNGGTTFTVTLSAH